MRDPWLLFQITKMRAADKTIRHANLAHRYLHCSVSMNVKELCLVLHVRFQDECHNESC